MGFTLPEKLEERVSKKDEITARRELYVAITRAKRFCTLSYPRTGYTGGDLTLAHIIAELPENALHKVSREETEAEILAEDPKAYVASTPAVSEGDTITEIRDLVKENYADRKVAVTHLNNFFSCPWKWYFRNFLSLPEPESESLQFGNLVHHALETIFKERLGKNAISELIEDGLDMVRISDERVRVRFKKDAEKVLERFVADYLPDIKDGARSEKEMSPYRDPDISDIEVTGKIDLVETLADGTVRVSDFKTGKPKPKREVEKRDEEGRMSDYLRQLAMYSYLLMHDKSKTEASSSRLLFLETESDSKDAVYETRITDEEIQLLRKDLTDFNTLLKAGEWIERPCDFKPFGQQKECEYCALAKRIT
jgi:ATP-dependent helicase/DNAse subunit B